ncbi:hypothetical protein BC829DRAFT_222154 [Chytridium lagenaria]|nr:hypothetical protein BC829DRAFT_222154 [Chytridium lagenaria]
MHLFNAIILLAVIVASSTDAFFLAKNNIKKIVMFGDSVSDVGRAFNLTKNNGPPIPGNAFWQGRFSDGPVWIEVLAKDRKVALDSYACGGATTSDKLLRGFLGGKFSEPLRRDGSTIFVPGIDTQINEYLDKKESVPKDNILYAIWAGGNDRFNDELAGFNRSGSFYAKAQYEQWVQLAAAGAKNIMSVVPPPQTGFDIAYGLELQFQAAKFQVKNLDIKFGLSNSHLRSSRLRWRHSFMD